MGQGRNGGMSELDAAQEALAQAQAERAPVALARAEEVVAGLGRLGSDHAAEELLRAAGKAPRRGKRIRLLLQAASAWVAPLAAVAACREGCAACCYLPVAITSAEAMVLAQASGREARQPAEGRHVGDLVDDPSLLAEFADAAGASQAPPGPCPFLSGDRCSVYEARPLACRLHVNLDSDALLCQVVPGRPAQVPYGDTRRMVAHALSMQADEVLADIRAFFPVATE
jgi:Fe-S-cluster containining protein